MPNPEDLRNVYLKYMEAVTISEKPPITMDEFREIKISFENLEMENKKLLERMDETVELIKKDIHPDEELVEENKSLRDAYEWTSHENMELKNQIMEINENNCKIESK